MADGRRRGRPRLEAEGSTLVSLRVGNTTYDEIYAYARINQMKVAEAIRRAIELQIVADRLLNPRD